MKAFLKIILYPSLIVIIYNLLLKTVSYHSLIYANQLLLACFNWLESREESNWTQGDLPTGSAVGQSGDDFITHGMTDHRCK